MQLPMRRTPTEKFLQTPHRIYCFSDTPALCRRLLDAGARVIQLRHKTAGEAEFRRLAAAMAARVRTVEEAVLIVNDRVEIALEVGADGIHVGQEDMAFAEVIRRVPAGMIVGVSARTPAQARAAAAAGATYIGAGAVFATPTKPDAEVIGLKGLGDVIAAVTIPVVAIGGITLATVRPVLAAGARFCAVISGINDAADPAAALGRFLSESASLPSHPNQ